MSSRAQVLYPEKLFNELRDYVGKTLLLPSRNMVGIRTSANLEEQ
jgi:hypothetical protein